LSKHPLRRESERTGGGFRIYSSAHDTNSLFIPTVIGNMLNVEQSITTLELGRLTHVCDFPNFLSYCLEFGQGYGMGPVPKPEADLNLKREGPRTLLKHRAMRSA